MGDLMFDTNIPVLGTILGSIVAVGVGKVIEFFKFFVDYRRTEKVQFEDDEYYYYVKAVPKITVATPAKTVKRINSTTTASRSVTTERTARSASSAATTRSAERTGEAYVQDGRRSIVKNQPVNKGKSVTINGHMTGSREESEVDFEEIF